MAQLVQGDQNTTIARAMEYQRLVASGMPHQQAFQQAFPQGIPQAPTPKEQAKNQQSQALGQVAGSITGGLGTYYGASAIKSALAGKAAATAPTVAAETATAAAAPTAATGASTALGAGSVGSSGASGFLGSSASPVLYDATTGQAVASSSSGLPGLTSSGATAASSSPSMFSLSGAGSAGNVLLPAAGAVGAYDLFKNNRKGKRGYAQGAASGAAIGSFAGPLGTGIGAGVGLLAAALNERFNKKPQTRVEEGKWKELVKAGKITEAQMPQWVRDGVDIKDAGYRNDLASDFKGTDSSGAWVNNKFAKTRNESDLTVTDIQGFASALGKSKEELQSALNAGAVRERKGTIDIDWSKVTPPSTPAATPGVNKPATNTGSKLVQAISKSRNRR